MKRRQNINSPRPPPAKPKLDPFIPVIDRVLFDDKSRPRKQQHTAKRHRGYHRDRMLWQTERVFAQRGVFTVHGDDPRPLEEQCPDVVKRIILRNEAKAAAREFLEYANLDEYSIYPDIVGMSRHLSRQIFGF